MFARYCVQPTIDPNSLKCLETANFDADITILFCNPNRYHGRQSVCRSLKICNFWYQINLIILDTKDTLTTSVLDKILKTENYYAHHLHDASALRTSASFWYKLMNFLNFGNQYLYRSPVTFPVRKNIDEIFFNFFFSIQKKNNMNKKHKQTKCVTHNIFVKYFHLQFFLVFNIHVQGILFPALGYFAELGITITSIKHIEKLFT